MIHEVGLIMSVLCTHAIKKRLSQEIFTILFPCNTIVNAVIRIHLRVQRKYLRMIIHSLDTKHHSYPPYRVSFGIVLQGSLSSSPNPQLAATNFRAQLATRPERTCSRHRVGSLDQLCSSSRQHAFRKSINHITMYWPYPIGEQVSHWGPVTSTVKFVFRFPYSELRVRGGVVAWPVMGCHVTE
jgi:hypothetical protein